MHINYKIIWKQNYPLWNNFIDTNIERMLQSSNMKEALELIERVKK